MGNIILEVKDVSTTYQDKSVLPDMTFSVDNGEILSIVGESGSGKSTLLNAILGIDGSLKVSKGQILFDNQDLTRLQGNKRREYLGRQIAIIPQNPMSSFKPLRQLGKQFKEVCKSHSLTYNEVEIEELFQKVGLVDAKSILASYPYDMSGG